MCGYMSSPYAVRILIYKGMLVLTKCEEIYIHKICVRKDFYIQSYLLHISVYIYICINGNINKLSADRVFISEVDVRHQ